MMIDLTGIGTGNDMGSREAMTWGLAYLGLLLWMCAGRLDFGFHRRTDLPHTSGLVESALHQVQLGLVGGAIVLGMLFEIGTAIIAAMTLLVLLHAVAGYLDTRQAFPHRPVLPAEQHVHSVLDMAPWIGLGLVVAMTWPAAVDAGWSLALRRPALPGEVWMMVLVPAAILVGVPSLMELAAAWRARHDAAARRQRSQPRGASDQVKSHV